MNMILSEDIVSLTDFARGTKQHIAELQKNGRPRVLTHNGKAAAVVLSVEAYEDLAHEAYERRMDMRLKKSLDDYATGKRGKPLDEAFAEIRQRVSERRENRAISDEKKSSDGT